MNLIDLNYHENKVINQLKDQVFFKLIRLPEVCSLSIKQTNQTNLTEINLNCDQDFRRVIVKTSVELTSIASSFLS